jgi:hypothetical protein
VNHAERIASESEPVTASRHLRELCRRAKSVSRFVRLWCHDGECGAAMQFAGAENAPWNLPTGDEDAADLTARLLDCEDRRIVAFA